MANVDINGKLWQRVVGDFRRACLLRYEGKFSDSCKVLEQDLPAAIARWSEEDPSTPSAKRSVLELMFKEEQRRMDDAVLVHRMLSKSFSAEILPSVCGVIAQEVRDAVREQIRHMPPSTHASEFVVEDAPDRFGLRRPRKLPSPPRIQFDDIGGIIDSLQLEQSADFGANPVPAFA